MEPEGASYHEEAFRQEKVEEATMDPSSADEEKVCIETAVLLAPSAMETAPTTVDTNVVTRETDQEFKRASQMLGLLVGAFIQLSSLGANYVFVWHSATNPTEETSASSVLWTTFVWSGVTSAMGVFLLLLLSLLLHSLSLYHHAYVSQEQEARQERVLRKIESHFAKGALMGVCFSWLVTDLLLGLRLHVVHSMLTVLSVFVWSNLLAYLYHPSSPRIQDTFDDEAGESVGSENGLDEPLLAKEDSRSIKIGVFKKLLGHTQTLTIVMGLLSGCFVQCSSLGANYLMHRMMGHSSDDQQILIFSLVWSLIASTMGASILVLVRRMGVSQWMILASSPSASSSSINTTAAVQAWIETVEMGFAGGALVGVHLACLATDRILGLSAARGQWALLLITATVLFGYKFATACCRARHSDTLFGSTTTDNEILIV